MAIYVLSYINTRQEYVLNDEDIINMPLAFDNIGDCKLWVKCCNENAEFIEWLTAPAYAPSATTRAWSASVGATIWVIREMSARAEQFRKLLPE